MKTILVCKIDSKNYGFTSVESMRKFLRSKTEVWFRTRAEEGYTFVYNERQRKSSTNRIFFLWPRMLFLLASFIAVFFPTKFNVMSDPEEKDLTNKWGSTVEDMERRQEEERERWETARQVQRATGQRKKSVPKQP